MINVAIVEDSLQAAQTLQEYLTEYEKTSDETFHVVHYTNVINFLTNYSANFDLVFMDIELPHMNGMEGCRKLREIDKTVEIIFVTNMAQYAVEGYEVNAFDFVVKPVSYYDFSLKLTKVLEKIHMKDEYAVAIPIEGGIRKVLASEIKYIEIMKHNITIHAVSEDVSAYGTLKDIEKKLPTDTFVRCNSCYLVNLRYVKAVKDTRVILGTEELQISRTKRKDFLEALSNYLIKNI